MTNYELKKELERDGFIMHTSPRSLTEIIHMLSYIERTHPKEIRIYHGPELGSEFQTHTYVLFTRNKELDEARMDYLKEQTKKDPFRSLIEEFEPNELDENSRGGDASD